MTNTAYVDGRCKARGCESKRHYVVMGHCSNCGWDGYLWVTNGHTKLDAARTAECPRCLCRKIVGREFVEGNGSVA